MAKRMTEKAQMERRHYGWTFHRDDARKASLRSWRGSIDIIVCNDGSLRYRVMGCDYGRDGDYPTLDAAVARLS